jgi:DNA helicase-2/ATP-dependent DNA helicase PcrA
MPFDPFKGMNESQREAIASLDGPLLVVAGAGSGKTRVITHRIGNIIQSKGVKPDHVLAITFTNKAAREMQERVMRLISLQTPWITTFHSAGLRILKMESSHLGMEHPFTILDEDDQKKLFKEVYQEVKLDPKVIEPKRIQHRISAWKNELVNIEKREPTDDLEAWAIKCHAVYRRLCHEHCHLDFDDLLVMPVRLFESEPAVLKKWQERFPYILVDEYQDTNTVQYRLLRMLGEHRNICATGDPDQAIYGWRGADIKNILNFAKDFPDCKKVLLEQNYRSTKVILRAAQGVVQNNTEREDKTIRTDNDEGQPLTLVAVDDEVDESYGVAAKVESLKRSKNRAWADFAVFYRTNAQSRIIEDGLRRRGIPYRIVGGQRFYDREEVKHVLAWLKLLINPSDRMALGRIANVPKRGVGEKTLDALYELADEALVTPAEVLDQDDLLERVAVGRNGPPLRDLSRVWRSLKRLPKANPAACVRGAIDLTGLPEHYRKGAEAAEAQDRIANMYEVITAAEQYHESYPEGGIDGFLDLVSLNTGAEAREEVGEHADRVTLMTIHGSKGLEFPVVFITGCEDGVFPLRRMGVVENIEEERRLMYVGITRAMNELYLSRARCRMMYGQTFRNEPSQFLSEIPSDCFESKDATGRRPLPEPTEFLNPKMKKLYEATRDRLGKQFPGGLTTGAALKAQQQGGSISGSAGKNQEPEEFPDDDDFIEDSLGRIRRKATKAGPDAPEVFSDDPYQPGEAVIHSVFGKGTVRGLRGPPESRTIVIAFNQPVGLKELQLSFAAGKLSRG